MELHAMMERCPIRRLTAQLVHEAVLNEAQLADLQSEVEASVAAACSTADDSPFPDISETMTDVA